MHRSVGGAHNANKGTDHANKGTDNANTRSDNRELAYGERDCAGRVECRCAHQLSLGRRSYAVGGRGTNI